ncbi:MAG: hypothetical protein ACXW1F_08075 [Halobacteriota archaeon]
MKTIAEGKAQLERLLSEINNNAISRNESETRFHIIDRIIIECLGWPRDKVHVEQPLERTFTDYELGEPRRSIWEAKREGRIFELPADPNQKLVVDLPSVMSLGGEVAEAIRQVQRYCSERGVEVAVATNGPQLIAFLATRNDGKAPLKGRCLVTYSYKHLLDNFPKVWQMLSPAGIAERRLNRLLNVGQDASLPDKMSAYLLQYPLYRYSSDLQSSLRTISDLLLVDVVEQPEVERSFYEKCYCESGALSQHALVSKAILSSRYAAIFTPSEPGPAILPIMSGRGKPALTPSVMAESYSQRPLVLIGDVGVGKTSFLKHLIYVSAFEEFKKSVYIHRSWF